ncbi:c-type cytochrome [Altericroceibacterium endophyticum]|uniref:C-type cytochrome n=1 Tax=Altericroceibacterium endophyticum TaxID=1808508 RepID=A0A6I4T5N7_9SPHN|nr:cytochrome c [Altericroceibacterium endophyticum]MXO65230.1 c-type cytochrome [Altericroceibacterium endophyticum]
MNMRNIMTAGVMALALAACSGGSDSGEAPAGGPPEGQGGPPPMPQPITMAQRPNATGGEKLYVEKCIMCHGPNGMGTGLLGRRMDVALLEERTDLTVDYVTQAARMGIGNMPAIPRGEVSDDQMKQIAQYLASHNADAEQAADGEGASE